MRTNQFPIAPGDAPVRTLVAVRHDPAEPVRAPALGDGLGNALRAFVAVMAVMIVVHVLLA